MFIAINFYKFIDKYINTQSKRNNIIYQLTNSENRGRQFFKNLIKILIILIQLDQYSNY